jgi:hypothetical protein
MDRDEDMWLTQKVHFCIFTVEFSWINSSHNEDSAMFCCTQVNVLKMSQSSTSCSRSVFVARLFLTHCSYNFNSHYSSPYFPSRAAQQPRPKN